MSNQTENIKSLINEVENHLIKLDCKLNNRSKIISLVSEIFQRVDHNNVFLYLSKRSIQVKISDLDGMIKEEYKNVISNLKNNSYKEIKELYNTAIRSGSSSARQYLLAKNISKLNASFQEENENFILKIDL